MSNHSYRSGGKRNDGYSLLEVLIALLVFSVGLLGLAAMLVSAVRGNHQAYHHSQAVYIAESMSVGLSANFAGIHADAYETGGWIDAFDDPNCAPCTPAQSAARDLATWTQMASRGLPGGEILVNCDSPTVPRFPEASYNGVCTLAVRWSETGDVGQSQASSQRVFTWMVQP